MESFGRSFPSSPITVFTRPELADIYRHNPHVSELRFAAFPVGSTKHFGINQVRPLWRELTQFAATHSTSWSIARAVSARTSWHSPKLRRLLGVT